LDEIKGKNYLMLSRLRTFLQVEKGISFEYSLERQGLPELQTITGKTFGEIQRMFFLRSGVSSKGKKRTVSTVNRREEYLCRFLRRCESAGFVFVDRMPSRRGPLDSYFQETSNDTESRRGIRV